jgi:hypothetical protein
LRDEAKIEVIVWWELVFLETTSWVKATELGFENCNIKALRLARRQANYLVITSTWAHNGRGVVICHLET